MTGIANPPLASMDEHHVIVVGGGFGGMEAVHHLDRPGFRITLIDQRNHHLFQPLLYQVATTILAPSHIAWPLRNLMAGRPRVTTLLGTVTGVEGNSVLLDDATRMAFDSLIIATGARHAYFGHDEWEAFAPGLKTLDDATTIRSRLLLAFERAEREVDPAIREALMTVAIIGGGPTGVELAGIIAELAHDTIRPDFRLIDTRTSRILLVEAGPQILSGFPKDLSTYATRALQQRGVEVRLGEPVTACTVEGIKIADTFVPCGNAIWAAGIQASQAASWLGADADRVGRVVVQPDLTVKGRPDIHVIGDTAAVTGPDGTPVPGIAPAAKQQGRYAAKAIRARLEQRSVLPFRYRHRGDLATIGKRAGIVRFGSLHLRGALAWWVWGLAHIFFLINARSRFAVAWSWLWSYLRRSNSARLITRTQTPSPVKPAPRP